ncbi:hypothetical protein [Nostoc sp.]|uniref:hypothetical protein n=1 Tax=Nostoc sp. TaxID=1180 RepID=UPI002FF86F1D
MPLTLVVGVNQKDALYETLLLAYFFAGVHGFALSVRVVSRREAMPLAQPLVEKALRCAIENSKFPEQANLSVESIQNPKSKIQNCLTNDSLMVQSKRIYREINPKSKI